MCPGGGVQLYVGLWVACTCCRRGTNTAFKVYDVLLLAGDHPRLFMYTKVLLSVGLDESGEEMAKLRCIVLVLSCVDLGQSLMQPLCAVSPL
jgi:hypothetical protein